MALAGFAPSSFASIVCTNASQTVATTGTTLLITNVGTSLAYVAVGATVTTATGVAVLPGDSVALTAGANLSAIGQGAVLNIVGGV